METFSMFLYRNEKVAIRRTDIAKRINKLKRVAPTRKTIEVSLLFFILGASLPE